jgi:hypothetical protein
MAAELLSHVFNKHNQRAGGTWKDYATFIIEVKGSVAAVQYIKDRFPYDYQKHYRPKILRQRRLYGLADWDERKKEGVRIDG